MLGRYRPIDLSAQRPPATKSFRAKKHALINSRNTSAVPRVIDVELLSLFIDPFGKIRGRRYTRATALRQRKLAKVSAILLIMA
jgi:ribosomal protein S18